MTDPTDQTEVAELERRLRSVLRAVVADTPVPGGLEARLLDAVTSPEALACEVAPPPGTPTADGQRPAAGSRRWLPLVAAAAAAALVLGSVGWWAALGHRTQIAESNGTTTVPWDASVMASRVGFADTALPRVTEGVGHTAPCGEGDLHVVASRNTVGPSTGNGTLHVVSDLVVQSSAAADCALSPLTPAARVTSDGQVLPLGALGSGPYRSSVAVAPGDLVHLRLPWISDGIGPAPARLVLLVDGPSVSPRGGGVSEQDPVHTPLAVDVSGVERPGLPSGKPGAGDSAGVQRYLTWQVTSVARPGSLASLTATVIGTTMHLDPAPPTGWAGSSRTGEVQGTLRLVNDTGSTVRIKDAQSSVRSDACPDLVASTQLTFVDVAPVLRGPLPCDTAPEVLEPGGVLDVALSVPSEWQPVGKADDAIGSASGIPAFVWPLTAQLVRGDDVVTGSNDLEQTTNPHAGGTAMRGPELTPTGSG